MKLLRAASAGFAEIRGFLPKLWGLARQLFNEIMGMVFLALAVFFTVGAHGLVHTYRELDENPDQFTTFLVLAFFVLMFATFGVSSFLRARRIARGKD